MDERSVNRVGDAYLDLMNHRGTRQHQIQLGERAHTLAAARLQQLAHRGDPDEVEECVGETGLPASYFTDEYARQTSIIQQRMRESDLAAQQRASALLARENWTEDKWQTAAEQGAVEAEQPTWEQQEAMLLCKVKHLDRDSPSNYFHKEYSRHKQLLSPSSSSPYKGHPAASPSTGHISSTSCSPSVPNSASHMSGEVQQSDAAQVRSLGEGPGRFVQPTVAAETVETIARLQARIADLEASSTGILSAQQAAASKQQHSGQSLEPTDLKPPTQPTAQATSVLNAERATEAASPEAVELPEAGQVVGDFVAKDPVAELAMISRLLNQSDSSDSGPSDSGPSDPGASDSGPSDPGAWSLEPGADSESSVSAVQHHGNSQQQVQTQRAPLQDIPDR